MNSESGMSAVKDLPVDACLVPVGRIPALSAVSACSSDNFGDSVVDKISDVKRDVDSTFPPSRVLCFGSTLNGATLLTSVIENPYGIVNFNACVLPSVSFIVAAVDG